MKIDLSKHITDYLNRFDSVQLSGLGKFIKNYTSAKFSNSIHELSAPKVELNFTENKEENHDLADWIAIREGISIEDAKRVVQYFIEKKLHELKIQGESRIYPLGTLSSDGDEITFVSKDSKLINQYFGLKEIAIKPAERSESEKSSLKPVAKTPFSELITEQKSSSPLWRLLGIIFLALALIFLYKKCLSDQQQVELLGDNTEPSALDARDGKELTQDSIQNDPLTESSVKSSSQQKVHIDQLNGKDINNVLESEDLKNAAPETIVDCVIILGAYKKQRNALRMMRDVENAGYKLYVGVNGDFTRVGLTYNCAKADLVNYIQNIRREFVREAWYLIPQLRVEYED